MIVLTVGTQLPFDRLVQAVDEIAPALGQRIIAQIGKSNLLPKNFEYHEKIRPADFDALLREASLVVSHAGIGSIISARRQERPILLLPRLAKFGEHRNDHQAATAKAVKGRPGIYVAADEGELRTLLLSSNSMTFAVEIAAERERMANALRQMIET